MIHRNGDVEARLVLSRAARGYAAAVATVALAGAMAKMLHWLFGLPDPAMVFITGVLFTAVIGGLAPSLLSSVLSLLVYDFFFVDPLYTFTVTQPQDLVAMCVFLIVAILTSHLTGRARDQAEAARSREAQVMEAIEDGLIVLDTDGVVAHVNEVACAILDVERDEVLGARFDDLAATHSHYLRLREALREFREHPERERHRVEIRLFLRGRDHHYVLRPTPFRTRDGSPAGLILALQDVTYLRDQETRRENLVATLSHELGTPLTSLKMAVELLRQQARGGDVDGRELVETAHEDVLRLQDVAQRFLDLARSRATTIALDRQAVDLGAVTSRVLKLFTLQAREKGVELELANKGTEIVMGDETKLTWALSNLIANAIRYTPSGGRVAIDVASRDPLVLVSVRDTGAGIPAEHQERIFEPFAQSSGAGEPGSAGLGLAIVRDIVQAHGGRIFLDSAPGQGTRFTLELPRG